ncbi:MAG: hypothetical protein IJ548_08465 [Paludibacteraceae bacterium]|nr:hypothetical protein [Paludibacteraceae bacterium]MBQ8715551.1 hypothetical protein [Prevotella sp.]
MVKKVLLLSIGFIVSAHLNAAEPEETVVANTTATENVQAKPANSNDYEKWRIGSYGEILAAFKDYGLNRFYGNSAGNTKKNHNEISIPRFILQGEYKITPKWILSAEIEFEAGGTGTAVEMEAQSGSENGEYEVETEKGGEVALEQFHITRLIIPEFNVRVGHIILPVGLTNSHHEPLNFFTAARPEGATTLLASTWHETGLEFFGTFGKGTATFDYQAMVTTGLNPNGFDCYHWIKKAKQGFLEVDNFSAPAYTLRLDWRGIPGLRVGASMLFNPNAGKNADKLITYDDLGKINVFLYSFDAQYINKYITARANYLSGNITETIGITATNRRYSNKSPYSRMGPVAKRAVDWSAEVGVNLKSFFPGVKGFPTIYPFVHYNYYNPQEECEQGLVADKRCQVSLWSMGLNWKPLPNLVVKADYTTRQIGTSKMFGSSNYNSENEFRIGVAYQLWFAKK